VSDSFEELKPKPPNSAQGRVLPVAKKILTGWNQPVRVNGRRFGPITYVKKLKRKEQTVAKCFPKKAVLPWQSNQAGR
jgi:hypothetical protein